MRSTAPPGRRFGNRNHLGGPDVGAATGPPIAIYGIMMIIAVGSSCHMRRHRRRPPLQQPRVCEIHASLSAAPGPPGAARCATTTCVWAEKVDCTPPVYYTRPAMI